MIRDQLALGRPDNVAIVFDRKVTRRTPGRFLTRVINRGADPAIQIHYKRSKVKQYFKEGRALRTETTVNDTRDFQVGRLVTAENWEALLRIGHEANERLLRSQLEACACAPDARTLERVVLPSKADGLPAPGLRFGDPRVMALCSALCAFAHLFAGLTNRSLRTLVAGHIPGYTARQATYDLRRLRRKGLIRRIPRSQRYELTGEGRRLVAVPSGTKRGMRCRPTKRGTGTCTPRTDRSGPSPRGSSGTCCRRRRARRLSSAGDPRPPQPRCSCLPEGRPRASR